MRNVTWCLVGVLAMVGAPACGSGGAQGGTGGTGGQGHGGHTVTGGNGGGGAGDPAQLDPPKSGEGFQISIPEFEVAQGAEVQDCYFFKVSELAQSGGLDP